MWLIFFFLHIYVSLKYTYWSELKYKSQYSANLISGQSLVNTLIKTKSLELTRALDNINFTVTKKKFIWAFFLLYVQMNMNTGLPWLFFTDQLFETWMSNMLTWINMIVCSFIERNQCQVFKGSGSGPSGPAIVRQHLQPLFALMIIRRLNT